MINYTNIIYMFHLYLYISRKKKFKDIPKLNTN